MQESIEQNTEPEAADVLTDAAARASAWAGEPFLHEGEPPTEILAAGTARRRALDEAIEEIETGLKAPSTQWKVRYSLMLGLERVLSEKPPHLADGTELRRHQIDALAGMLTELIAAAQRQGEEEANGNGLDAVEPADEDEDDDEVIVESDEDDDEVAGPAGAEDPGAVRRYRFRHPTASGKTIAAAGFVEAARTMGVLILTHRRLLVDQFRRELTDHGYKDRLAPEVVTGMTIRKPDLITIQTYAWFARHVGELNRDAYQLVICDEAHTALGEKTSAAIRSFPEPIYIGMTATEQLIAKQVSDVFPASVDDLPLSDAARRGLIAPLRSLRVPPVAAIHNVPIVGGDFDEGALAAALDHQALNLAAASLYKRALRLDAGCRLRRRRRARVQPRDRVPRDRPEDRGGQRQDAARQARRDPRRLRARRDRRADQRDAARRGLELAARDDRHAPRADRVEARLPAADRPDHAHAPAQGGRHRRRLRPQGRDAQRARRLAAQPARRGLLP